MLLYCVCIYIQLFTLFSYCTYFCSIFYVVHKHFGLHMNLPSYVCTSVNIFMVLIITQLHTVHLLQLSADVHACGALVVVLVVKHTPSCSVQFV